MSNPIPLGEALAVIIDHRGKTPRKLGGDFTAHGVPVVSAIHVKNGRIDWSQRERFVSESMFHKWMPVKLKKNDLLLTSEAPLGEVALVPDDRDLVLSQRLFALRGKPDVLHTPYLYYYFRTPQGQADLQSRASGSTVLGIRQSQLVKIELRLPPLIEQRRIAGVLGAFDELIETESKLAGSLSTLSDALGQDFLGSLGPTTGETQVQDVAEITKGYSYKSSELVEGSGWLVGLKTVGRDGTFKTDGVKALTADPRQAQLVDTGDLVVAQTDLTQARAVIGRAVRVRRGTLTGKLVASLDLAVVRPKTNATPEYLEAVLRSTNFREHVLGFCNGTTVLHMGAAAIPSFPVTIPDRDQMIRFSERVRVLREGCDQALDSADELRRTRDELLPLLMSGAIRVSDVEDSVP